MGEELKSFDMQENVSDNDFLQDNEDVNFLSENEKYPSEGFKITHKHKIALGVIAIIVGVLVILGIILSSVGIFLVIDPFAWLTKTPNSFTLEGTVDLETYLEDIIEDEKFLRYPPKDSLKTNYKVRNTAEYQLTIDPSKFDKKNRGEIVDIYLEYIREFIQAPFYSSNGVESIRKRYSFNDNQLGSKDQCGQKSTHIRIRDYIEGPNKGSVTIDAKGNGSTKKAAMKFPFQPNPAFPDFPFDNSYGIEFETFPAAFQKLEQDYHVCNSTKFSRESRIFMKHMPSIETCYDILLLYPWIFPDITPDMYYNQIKAGDNETWWVFEHKAYLYSDENGVVFSGDYLGPNLGGGTLIESTFTLRYDSVNDAHSEKKKPIKSGNEWSLRRYSLDDGKSEEMDENVTKLLDNMYLYMAKILDEKEKKCSK